MEFERFRQVPLPAGAAPYSAPGASPAIMNVTSVPVSEFAGENPTICEETFTRLISAGRFEAAWDLLTPDTCAGHSFDLLELA